uniref:Uncharacterized protein 035R n=2 Tax=Anthurium amnicola TaxID=1678845 RepID=A0A1D1ZA86_9ARAE
MVAAGNGDGVSSTEGAKSHLDGADSVAEPPDRSAAVAVRGLTNGTFEICSDGHVGEVAGRGGQGREGIGKVGEEESSLDSRSNKGGFAENEHPDAGIDENDDAEDFFDPRDMMSTMSSSDTEDAGSFRHGGSGRCHTPLASQSEFYDATEDFFSDGSVSRSSSFSRATIEADLRSIRLNLFEEIERRKKAEEILDHMQNMFQRITRQLSLVGSSFPPIQPGVNMQYDVDSAAQLCQEVVVTRFVSEALESGLAQAETEAAAEVIIEAKNHEISRFKDRLQYYEAMNQEMSQRNQEAIGMLFRHLISYIVQLFHCITVILSQYSIIGLCFIFFIYPLVFYDPLFYFLFFLTT